MVSSREYLMENGIDNMSMNGYLICENCNGYYQLQEGETPSDFDFCECGGHLNYHETLDFFSEKNNETVLQFSENNMDYDEIQEMVINLKNKAEKRKKEFEELSKKVEIQEEILNEIKDGKFNLWENDAKPAKNTFNKVENQLNISGNSDIYSFDEKSLKQTMEKEEAKLVARIQEKRSKVRSQKSSDYSFKEGFFQNKGYSSLNIRMSILGLIVILLLVAIIYLYFFK